MNPRTTRPVQSSFQPGYIHPAGSEVTLLEPLDPERRVWIVELRVPDASLAGDAWYDHAELSIKDLDFTAELKGDMLMAGDIEPPKEPPTFQDIAVADGSHELPRKAA